MIIEHIRFMARCNPIAEWIAENGATYATGERTFKGRRMKRGHCYYNATKLALRNPRLTYVEGYADSIIPLPHAWCIDKDGMVVDPTWDTATIPHSEYFGIAFSDDYLNWATRTNNCYGLLDAYYNRRTIGALLDGTVKMKWRA